MLVIHSERSCIFKLVSFFVVSSHFLFCSHFCNHTDHIPQSRSILGKFDLSDSESEAWMGLNWREGGSILLNSGMCHKAAGGAQHTCTYMRRCTCTARHNIHAHMKQHKIQALPHNEQNIHAHKCEAPHSVWHTTTAWSIQSTAQHICVRDATQRNCIYETGNSRRQSTTHTTAAQHKCTWGTSKHVRQWWEKPNTAVYVKKSKYTPFPHFASFTTQQALRDPHTNKMSQMFCQANFWVQYNPIGTNACCPSIGWMHTDYWHRWKVCRTVTRSEV